MRVVVWRAVVVLGLLLIAAGCTATGDRDRSTEQRVAVDVLSTRIDFIPEFAKILDLRAQECAVFNGVDYTPDAVVLTTYESNTSPTRLTLAEEGSGITMSYISPPTTIEEVETPPVVPEIAVQIMSVGPVSTPSGRYAGGCFDWAQGQLETNERYQRLLQSQASFAEYLEDFREESPLVLDANALWAECMRSQGYQGLDKPGDQLQAIRDRIKESLENGRDPATVLEFDIAISLANWDCFIVVQDRQDQAWAVGLDGYFELLGDEVDFVLSFQEPSS